MHAAINMQAGLGCTLPCALDPVHESSLLAQPSLQTGSMHPIQFAGLDEFGSPPLETTLGKSETNVLFEKSKLHKMQ